MSLTVGKRLQKMDNKRHMHGSFTFKVEQSDNGSFVASIIQETKRREDDDVGALYYVIVVIMIYGCSILMMIASYIRKNNMDRKLNRYIKEMANVRKRERQFQMFTAAKKAAAAQEMLDQSNNGAHGPAAGDGDCHRDRDRDRDGRHRDGDDIITYEGNNDDVIQLGGVKTSVRASIVVENSDKLSVSPGNGDAPNDMVDTVTGHKKLLRCQDRVRRVQIMRTPSLLNPNASDTDVSGAEDSNADGDGDGDAEAEDDDVEAAKEMDRLEVVIDDISANTETNSECSFLGSLLSVDTSPSDDSERLSFSGVQIVSSV